MKTDPFEPLKKQALTTEHFELHEKATFKLNAHQWDKILNAIPKELIDVEFTEMLQQIEYQAIQEQKQKEQTPDVFAAVEVYTGRFYSGYKELDAARDMVHKLIDETPKEAEYEFKTVQVIDEWSSDDFF